MQFNFPTPKRGKEEIQIPREMEMWTPIEDKPNLNSREMNTILSGDQVIESMHIALPSFLVATENEGLGYYPCLELDRYFILAKLRQSPYLVFYEEKVASKQMQKSIKEGFAKNPGNYYLLDVFFTPFFGGITPRYFLFQRANMDTIPETAVLFRDLS